MLQKATGKIDQIRENRWERAILKMKLYDADFDLENLAFECEEVFKEFYCNFLAGNKTYIELVCEGTVASLLKALIELREKEGWKFKFEEFLDCGPAFFMGAKLEGEKP